MPSDESSDDDKPQKANAKAKSSGKQSTGGKKVVTAEGMSGSTNAFLTAAEQREQDKKSEKKATEEAYSFLADVQDVCFNWSFFASEVRVLFRKTVGGLGIPIMTHEHCMFHLKLGKNLRHSRSRCVRSTCTDGLD